MTMDLTHPAVARYLDRLAEAARVLPRARADELTDELRAHLTEALADLPAGETAAVLQVLDRLGSPEDIVAAEREQAGGPVDAVVPGGMVSALVRPGPYSSGVTPSVPAWPGEAAGATAGPRPGTVTRAVEVAQGVPGGQGFPGGPGGPGAGAGRAGTSWGVVEVLAVLLLTVGVVTVVGPLLGIVLAWLSERWSVREKVAATLAGCLPALVAVVGLVMFFPAGSQVVVDGGVSATPTVATAQASPGGTAPVPTPSAAPPTP